MTTPVSGPLTEADVRRISTEVLFGGAPGSKCSADNPHKDLSYRGNGQYACPCGKKYRKSSAQRGALEEVS